MGYVPPGEVPSASQGHELSRSQYRGTRARRPDLTKPGLDSRQVGQLGEDLACGFLVRQGLRIVERNVRIGRGELDAIVRHGDLRIAVEIKTLSDPGDDPFRTFTPAKRHQVIALAAGYRCDRSDLVVVEFHSDGVLFRWLPAQ